MDIKNVHLILIESSFSDLDDGKRKSLSFMEKSTEDIIV